jgi:hypothetical protein
MVFLVSSSLVRLFLPLIAVLRGRCLCPYGLHPSYPCHTERVLSHFERVALHAQAVARILFDMGVFCSRKAFHTPCFLLKRIVFIHLFLPLGGRKDVVMLSLQKQGSLHAVLRPDRLFVQGVLSSPPLSGF